MMTSKPLNIKRTTIFWAQRWWKATRRHHPIPHNHAPNLPEVAEQISSKSLTNQAMSEAGRGEACSVPRATCQHTLHDHVQDISSWSRRLHRLAEPFLRSIWCDLAVQAAFKGNSTKKTVLLRGYVLADLVPAVLHSPRPLWVVWLRPNFSVNFPTQWKGGMVGKVNIVVDQTISSGQVPSF